MITLPEKCFRDKDCQPLAQIQSDCGESFFCCGLNTLDDRSIEQDKYTVCFKGPHKDEISHNDRRDLIHNAAVLIQALAVIEEWDAAAPKPAKDAE